MSPKILTVEKPDKPGRPELIEVIGTSVHLQWTTPHSDGETEITQYMVMFCASDKTEYTTVPVDTNTESLISYTIRNQLQIVVECGLPVLNPLFLIEGHH